MEPHNISYSLLSSKGTLPPTSWGITEMDSSSDGFKLGSWWIVGCISLLALLTFTNQEFNTAYIAWPVQSLFYLLLFPRFLLTPKCPECRQYRTLLFTGMAIHAICVIPIQFLYNLCDCWVHPLIYTTYSIALHSEWRRYHVDQYIGWVAVVDCFYCIGYFASRSMTV